MLIHDLVQGSPEWREHRAKYKNASDTPVIMGLSKYKTRTQFLDERKSGIIADVDPATQKRFDDGHRYEALARPIAEKIIGTSLYPVTGSEGEYGASFDGIDISEEIDFEHKSLNDELRAVKSADDLGEEYLVQMEHQLMVCNGKKALFMASKWDANDELVEEIHVWYEPDATRRQRILDAWAQYDIDFENHVVTEVIEKPKAQPIMALPALAIQIKGEVTLSNLPEFKTAATAFIASIKTDLKTDEDFANAEEMVKFCKKAEDNIDLTKKAAIAQTSSIDELMRTMDFISEELKAKRLMLDKLVKSQKETIKLNAVNKAKETIGQFLIDCERDISPIRLNVDLPSVADAIYGLKTIESMHNKLGDAVANSKIAIFSATRDILAKQAWLKEHAAGYEFLLNDLQNIIYKHKDDFELTVTSRIGTHKESEAKKAEQIKLEAQAELIRKQEAEKLTESIASETSEVAQESVESAANTEFSTIETTDGLGGKHYFRVPPNTVPVTQYFSGVTPTENEMVTALSVAFKVDEMLAHKWAIEADWTKYVPHKKAA